MNKFIGMLDSPTARSLIPRGTNVFLLECRSNSYSLDDESSDFVKTGELIDIISKLRSWGPVISRNYYRGDQYELYLRKLAIQVHRWMIEIRKHNCSYVIFETMASHHVENMCLEIACDFTKVKKIFLSHSPFTYRLLPVLQEGDYSTRKLLLLSLNDWTLKENEIDVFSEQWSSRTRGPSTRETSFIFALILILRKAITVSVYDLFSYFLTKWNFIKSTSGTFGNRRGFPAYIELRLILQQKKALRYFEKNASLNEFKINELKKNQGKQVLLYYSHFQPESSSFPIGAELGNQIDLIYEIRQKFPRLVILYQEHPHIKRYSIRGAISGVGICRSIDYYKQLEALGVVFLPFGKKYDQIFNLNRKIQALTISGRIAIERAMQGLETFVVGHPWYKGLPGTYDFEDFLGLKPNEPRSSFTQNMVVSWIEKSHDGNTIAPGPWSIFHGNFENLDEVNHAYISDLSNLISLLSEKSNLE